jgi:hypothetical protein
MKFSAENEKKKNYSKLSCKQSEGNSAVCRRKFPRKCIFARNSTRKSPENIILQEIPPETYKKCKKKLFDSLFDFINKIEDYFI